MPKGRCLGRPVGKVLGSENRWDGRWMLRKLPVEDLHMPSFCFFEMNLKMKVFFFLNFLGEHLGHQTVWKCNKGDLSCWVVFSQDASW